MAAIEWGGALTEWGGESTSWGSDTPVLITEILSSGVWVPATVELRLNDVWVSAIVEALPV